jgi:hypothetical protein
MAATISTNDNTQMIRSRITQLSVGVACVVFRSQTSLATSQLLRAVWTVGTQATPHSLRAVIRTVGTQQRHLLESSRKNHILNVCGIATLLVI